LSNPLELPKPTLISQTFAPRRIVFRYILSIRKRLEKWLGRSTCPKMLRFNVSWSKSVFSSHQLLMQRHPANQKQVVQIKGADFTHRLWSDRGVLIALSIIGIWAISLYMLLSTHLEDIPLFWRVLATLWQTFLYTGLFITAHDAMHGCVAPRSPKLNSLIGSITLGLYALFSYKKMIRTHWLHHQHPASEADPDFHNGQIKNFFAWYLYFMFRYWSWLRLLGLMVIYNTMHLFLHVSEANLNWFWVVPAIASSAQLFFFGTYLPHREPAGGYTNVTHAKSTNWPSFVSFITCYHFGYHEEHHEDPSVPWWLLPKLHRDRLSKAS
jgi:beta-carotene/zeaxanthin 4-ketolase